MYTGTSLFGIHFRPTLNFCPRPISTTSGVAEIQWSRTVMGLVDSAFSVGVPVDLDAEQGFPVLLFSRLDNIRSLWKFMR